MHRVGRWLEKNRPRDQRAAVSVSDAIVGDQGWSYILHRLRYFVPSQFVFALIHLTEVYLLLTVFPQDILVGSIAAQVAAVFFTSFFWGGLEEFRNQVRRSKDKEVAFDISCRWLRQISSICLLVMAIITAQTLLVPLANFKVPLAHSVYIFACGVRACTDIVMRTYYSGVFAKYRVYRPIAYTIAIEIGVFVLTIGLVGIVGAYSLSITMIVGSIAIGAVNYHYISKAYRALHLMRPTWRNRNTKFRMKPIHLRRFIGYGIGFAVNRFTMLLSLWLVYRGSADRLSILFHMISPLVGMSGGWVQPFYFDFRKHVGGPFRRFIGNFEQKLQMAALIVPVAIWLCIAVLFNSVFQSVSWGFVMWLFPLLILRSWASLIQMLGFSRDQHLSLIGAGVILLALPVAEAFSQDELSTTTRLMHLNIVLGLSAVYLTVAYMNGRRKLMRASFSSAASPFSGLRQLVRAENAGSLLVLDFAKPLPGSPSLGTIYRELVASLDQRAVLWKFGPKVYLWREETSPAQLSCEDLIIMSSGSLVSFLCHQYKSGKDAAAAFVAKDIGHGCFGVANASADENLADEFKKMIPNGEMLTAYLRQSKMLQGLSRVQRAEFMRRVANGVEQVHGLRMTSLPFEVSVWCPGGIVRAVFLLPKSVPAANRQKWHAFMLRRNFTESLQVS